MNEWIMSFNTFRRINGVPWVEQDMKSSGEVNEMDAWGGAIRAQELAIRFGLQLRETILYVTSDFQNKQRVRQPVRLV